jgi:protein-S-isoprenylcysteine O-methyltransferase Ste14
MIRKVIVVLGSALFLILAPGIVAGLVPWWLSQWRVQAPFFGFPPIRVIGILLITAGVLVLLESFVRFAVQGLGTPAIVYPPRHLVVTGFYRYVRNPMYVAVVSTILGEAIVSGSLILLGYASLVWLVSHLFVVCYEEPVLRKKFGAEYVRFCGNVPRWIPRLRPWNF